MDPSPALKRPTVAASANQCLESFQRCLISASSVHPREVSMVEDQLARFSSWATGIQVFAPGSTSMDHRLRFAPEVQSVVAGLLETLDYRVRTCSSALAQLAGSSTSNDSAGATERLGQSFLDIAAEITRLNKLSNLIRRASKDTQVLKASNFQIRDDEGMDVEPLLLGHFEHHISDWFPDISETIRQRLARAMLLRRKTILYRRHRQGNNRIRSENTIAEVSVTLPGAQSEAKSPVQAEPTQPEEKTAVEKPASTMAPSQVRSATTLAPEKFHKISSSPSIVSASRTIASGKHQALKYPPAPGFAAKRRFEQLKSQRIAEAAGMGTEQSLQELLDADLQAIGEITCPYCLYALPAEEVFDERRWQNHVKNDLDPYVCLFEDCDQPDVLYTHSDEWLGHLHQHAKIWRCTSHREMGPFSTLEEYMQHMREVHATKLNDKQLRVVANRNSRKPSKLFSSCPLCGTEESQIDGRLEEHLAGHLRSLALKSLPSYQDEVPDDVGDGNNSIDGSRPRSRSTIREMQEEEQAMILAGAEDFWEQWNPQLTEIIPLNFLGDAYFEQDLGDNAALVASLFFDTMIFKNSLENLVDDPILQSILQKQQQQQGRIEEVTDVGTNDSSGLPTDQEAASSSKAPVSETSGQEEVKNSAGQGPVDPDNSRLRTEIENEEWTEAQRRQVESDRAMAQNLVAEEKAEIERREERARQEQEQARKAAELVRKIAARRKQEERARQEQEQAKEAAELLRKIEAGKKQEERARQEQEQKRKAAELVRKIAARRKQEEQQSQATVSQTASGQGVHIVDKGSAVTKESIVSFDPDAHEYSKRLANKLLERARDKPEHYKEFMEILEIIKRDKTTIDDIPPRLRTILMSDPELSAEIKLYEQARNDAKSAGRGSKAGSKIGDQDDNPAKDGGIPAQKSASRNDLGKDKSTGSAGQATKPPGASLTGSSSKSPTEQKKPLASILKKQRSSGVYVDGRKVLDLNSRGPSRYVYADGQKLPDPRRRGRPATRYRSPSPGGENRPGSFYRSPSRSTSLDVYLRGENASREKDKDRRRRPLLEDESQSPPGTYDEEEKVIYVNSQNRLITKHERPPSSMGFLPRNPSINQAPTPSAPQDLGYASGPRDSPARRHDLGSSSGPMALDAIRGRSPPQQRPYYRDYSEASDSRDLPQRTKRRNAVVLGEDERPNLQNPRQRPRNSGIYINGEKVQNLDRRTSPVRSRNERIVVVDPPPTYRPPPLHWTSPPAFVPPPPSPYINRDDSALPTAKIVDVRAQSEYVERGRQVHRPLTYGMPPRARSFSQDSTYPWHTPSAPRPTRNLDENDDENLRRRVLEERQQREREDLEARIRAQELELRIRAQEEARIRAHAEDEFNRRLAAVTPVRQGDAARRDKGKRVSPRDTARLDTFANNSAKSAPPYQPPGVQIDFEQERLELQARGWEQRARMEMEHEKLTRLLEMEIAERKRLTEEVRQMEERRQMYEERRRPQVELVDYEPRRRDRETRLREQKEREMDEVDAQRYFSRDRARPRPQRVLYDDGTYRWE